MQNFFAGVLIKVLTDEQVQAAIKNLLGDIIAERIVPLIPLSAASAARAIGVLLPDIDMPDLNRVAEQVRTDLNSAIPDFDLGVPVLDDLLDFWRPKGV